MNTTHKLHELLQATLALAETPLMKLKENKNLMQDIKRIVSNQNFDSIMNALRNEKFNEENFTPNPIGLNPESLEFTKAYVNYQNVNYEVFAKNIEAKSFFSVLPNVKNSKPLPENLIQKLSEKVDTSNEAKKFKEVFNSIYSDKALQIGTSQDPTFITSYIDYSPYIYNYQHYLAIPTLAETVDIPIEISLKTLPTIDFENDKLDEFFTKYFQTEKIKDKLKKFILRLL